MSFYATTYPQAPSKAYSYQLAYISPHIKTINTVR